MLTLAEARDALADLGFWFLRKPPTGNLGFWVELACREFQRYARLPKAAQDPDPTATSHYSERLIQVDNLSPLPDTVHVDGNYNEPETEARIKDWHTYNWRIPLVVTAWNTKADGTAKEIRPDGENLWLPADLARSKNVRMYATDLSGFYEPWDATARYRLIGTYVRFRSYGGPAATAGKHTWARIGYLDLTGDTPGTPTSPEEVHRQNTYRVIAGVANAEAEMFFDSMNAYDDSILSVGFYQWTVGQVSAKKVSSGELGGFMALLKQRKAEKQDPSFDLMMGQWDLDVQYDWATITSANGLFNFDSKTYTTHLTEKRQSTGSQPIPITEGRRAQFFQSWHWFYRFQAASRFSSHYEWSMWHMARVRLRDILSTPWPSGGPTGFTPIVKTGTTTRPATIGEVYQSELSLALILRWHVWAPGEVIFSGKAGRGIRRAFNRACAQSADQAGIDVSISVDAWPKEWEDLLITGIEEQLREPVFAKARDRDKFIGSIERVKAVQTELDPPGLQSTRNFGFDDTNLPPAPPPEKPHA